MMDQLERFERDQEAMEREYENRIDGKCCCDCGETVPSPDPKTEWVWCLMREGYVNLGDLVEDIGCGCFIDKDLI